MTHEWDAFLPQPVKTRRGRSRQSQAKQGNGYSKRYRYSSRFDIYQPDGENSPIAKKITDIIWRVMFTIIKAMFITALAIMAFGASWLIVTVLTL